MRDSTGRGKFRAAHSQGQLPRRIQEDGYLAIKQKVARPGKWMKGEAGLERDIEAVAAVREVVGSNFNLTVDANNGYRDNFDGAIRFLEECDPYELYWIEEIVPEEIGSYERLLETMPDRGISCPAANPSAGRSCSISMSCMYESLDRPFRYRSSETYSRTHP